MTFSVVGVADAHRLQEEISHIASSEMEPPLRPAFSVIDIEGKTVGAVEILELPVDKKPSFYKPAGLQKGSYIRVANTDIMQEIQNKDKRKCLMREDS